MDMESWKAPGISNYREIQALGLEQYVAELDTYGFTVVPPEKAAPAGFAERLRDAVVTHTRGQNQADALINTIEKERRPVDGEHLFHTVSRDPVFRESMAVAQPSLSIVSRSCCTV